MKAKRAFHKTMRRLGWVRVEWLPKGVVPMRSHHREVVRARQGEALLREGVSLLRCTPDMQRWRKRSIAHLERFGRYNKGKRKPDG